MIFSNFTVFITLPSIQKLIYQIVIVIMLRHVSCSILCIRFIYLSVLNGVFNFNMKLYGGYENNSVVWRWVRNIKTSSYVSTVTISYIFVIFIRIFFIFIYLNLVIFNLYLINYILIHILFILFAVLEVKYQIASYTEEAKTIYFFRMKNIILFQW